MCDYVCPLKVQELSWRSFSRPTFCGINTKLGYNLQHSPFSVMTNLVYRAVNIPEVYSGEIFVKPKSCEIFLWLVDHCSFPVMTTSPL